MLCPMCGAYVPKGIRRCTVCGGSMDESESESQEMSADANDVSLPVRDDSPWGGYYRKVAELMESLSFWKFITVIFAAVRLCAAVFYKPSVFGMNGFWRIVAGIFGVAELIVAVAILAYIFKLGKFCKEFSSAFVAYIISGIITLISNGTAYGSGGGTVWGYASAIVSIAALYFLYEGFTKVCRVAELPEYVAEWDRLFHVYIVLLVASGIGIVIGVALTLVIRRALPVYLVGIGIYVVRIVILFLEACLIGKTADRFHKL